MTTVVSKFAGMAPRFAPALKKGMAQIAEDIDLSSGKIKAGAGHLPVGTGSGDSLVYSGGAWVSGSGKHFCPWLMEGTDVLFSLENGVAKKTVGAVTADLGQVLPGAPTVVSLLTSGDLCDDDTYFLTRRTATNPEYVVTRYNAELSVYVDVPFLDEDVIFVYVDGIEYSKSVAGSLGVGEFGMEETVGPSTYGYLHIRFLTDPSATIDCDLTPSEHFTSIVISKANGDIVYAITTTRSIGGVVDESGVGAISTGIGSENGTIRVTRPEVSDSLVSHWTIYRLSEAGGEFQFCVKLPITTTYYDDDLLVSELGAAPVTYYTSDQGNDILFSKPVAFDGLCGPHSAMLFGWTDSTLFWSEPGKPDGWPAYYSMNFPSRIKTVVSGAVALAVICETGAFRVDGTHPELLQQTPSIGAEPCLSTRAAVTSKGVVYMSDSGVCLFNMYETAVMTDALFGEPWFKGVDSGSVFFAENNGRIYVFHSSGVLVYEPGSDAWTTLSLVATAAYRRADDGGLYVISGGDVLKIGAGPVVPYRFLSGDYYGDGGDDTEFKGVRVAGSGDVTLGLYVDGERKVFRALDFSMDRGRIVQLRQEHAGRALWFELTGTGTVTEAVVL